MRAAVVTACMRCVVANQGRIVRAVVMCVALHVILRYVVSAPEAVLQYTLESSQNGKVSQLQCNGGLFQPLGVG
jgi:hypothetical protein